MKIFTKHAVSRMKKRNIGSTSVSGLLGKSGAKYLGRGKYKATKQAGGRSVTVVYKKKKDNRTAITVWKD